MLWCVGMGGVVVRMGGFFRERFLGGLVRLDGLRRGLMWYGVSGVSGGVGVGSGEVGSLLDAGGCGRWLGDRGRWLGECEGG